MRRSPEEIKTTLGKTVRHLRDERRLTQEELADKAGIHPHYVSDIERGLRNVAIVNLSYLADGLGMTAAELLRAAGL